MIILESLPKARSATTQILAEAEMKKDSWQGFQHMPKFNPTNYNQKCLNDCRDKIWQNEKSFDEENDQ